MTTPPKGGDVPRRRFGDVVVLLPGLTGSVLRKGGKDLWGPSAGTLLGAALSGGGRLRSLVLREDPVDRDDLGDGVVATRLFPDVHLIPGLWKIDGYSRLAETLCRGLGLVPGRSYFELPYDWRRDIRVAARLLARRAHEWLVRWRRTSGNDAARLVLVAHSMGGLVARAFLELQDGWRSTRALVTFGTPFRGAPSALDALCNGSRKGPLGLVDLTALARSCTSVHQLLPLYPVVDAGKGRLVRVTEVDLPNLKPSRAVRGLAFHEELRRAVESHRRSSRYRERGCAIYPVVGLGQSTPQSARLVDGRVEMLPTFRGEDHSGDGTVPRASATPLEKGHEGRAMYAGTRHASLQSAAATLTHVVGLLGGFEIDLDAYRHAQESLTRVALEVGDVFWRDEPVAICARVEGEPVRLTARVCRASGGPPVARAPLRQDPDGTHTAELPSLPPGSYRVTVTGGRSVEPAEDVFVVLPVPGEGP
jgi:pimeloyl-ACP methyl ester carboxylesterase